MGNGDREADKARIHEANDRTVKALLDYLLTSKGFTGYFVGRVVQGKIEMLKFEHTHPIDGHGRMGHALVRHDADRL